MGAFPYSVVYHRSNPISTIYVLFVFVHYIRVMHLKNIPLKAAVLLVLLPKTLYILGSILIPAHVHLINFIPSGV